MSFLKIKKDKNNLEYVDLPNAVAAFIVTSDEKVIMVEVKRPLVDKSLEIPAGLVDDNESYDEAIIRELIEETSINFTDEINNQTKRVFFNSAIGYSNQFLTLYIFKTDKEIKFNLEILDHEILNVKLVSIKEISEMIEKNELVDYKTILGLLAYKDYVKKY